MPTVKYIRCIVLAWVIYIRTIRFHYLISKYTIHGHTYIKTFIGCGQAQSQIIIRIGIAYHTLIPIINHTIMIAVYPDYIPRFCPIQFSTFIVSNLFFRLEHSICRIAIEISNGIAYLRTIHFCSLVTQYIRVPMNNTFRIGNARYLIFIVCQIKSSTIFKVRNMIIPIQ